MNNFKIGWVIPQRLPYARVMASTRLRVYDVMRGLKKQRIKTGFYSPFSRYDVVVFQKLFNSKAVDLAHKIKKRGGKVVFDINVNYIDADEMFVTKQHQSEIKKMLGVADVVITSSEHLRQLYLRHHPDVRFIGEIIEDRFFTWEKTHNNRDPVTLVFCGYAVKAKELDLIGGVLRSLYERYRIKLILICEKDPHLDIIPYTFFQYSHRHIPQLLLSGDIKISPRDLSRPYNLGHSFTRIGYAMALGLPVVASPVPSYQGSPALLVDAPSQWQVVLSELIEQKDVRQRLGKEGRTFTRSHFSSTRILKEYENLFQELAG